MDEQPKIRPKKQKLPSAAEQLVAAFFQSCKDNNVPQDQAYNFYKAGLFLQPKQLEVAAAARAMDGDGAPVHLGAGGARGGSKTHSFFAIVGADDCQRFAGLKVLFLRKVAKANKEQFNDFRIKIFPRLKHTYREQVGTLTFENGSTMVIGHFKDEKDIDNYLGLEYDVIAIEELTTLSYEKWKNVMSCLRTSKSGWRPRSYASWNWGGVGHAWVKRLFYDKTGDEKCHFIKMTVYDNKFVNKEYREYLESLTGWKRKSWLEGDPNFQAGQFFTAWSEQHHVLKAFDEKNIKRWYAGLDYGRTHPTVFLLAGEDINGNLYFIDEHSESQMTIEEHSINIHALLKRHHLEVGDLDFIAAGRDCFSAKDDGTTISDSYHENGITIIPAEIDRINGWGKMAERLGDPEKGIKPKMFIHQRCSNLIGQIPLAQHHEKRPEDIEKMDADENGEGGDDALDCARFVVSTCPSGVIRFAMPVSISRLPFQPIGQL